MLPQAAFWRGRRVLVTGHTGFKGAWLCLWLQRLGAEVTGLALDPETQPNLFGLLGDLGLAADRRLDIRDAGALRHAVQDAQPEVVLHLAAQALVRPSYDDPVGTFATNVMGTTHLLEAVRHTASVRVVVLVTTDKVYANREWPHPYRENDRLGGHDPYSASKAASELVIDCYHKAFLRPRGVALAAARAGNVIGGGDWAQDRLLPDAVRAWSAGQTLQVRRPDAVRPWQHVLEPLGGYLRLAEHLWQHPLAETAWNFGPAPHAALRVREVIECARAAFGRGQTEFAEGVSGVHEAGLLALDASLAHSRLGWFPRWDTREAIVRTLRWYQALGAGQAAKQLCLDDLRAYEEAA